MTHTRGSARPDDTGRRPTGRSHLEFLVVGLAAVIGLLAGVAAVVGVSVRPEPVTVSTVRAGTVELFGAVCTGTTRCSQVPGTGAPTR